MNSKRRAELQRKLTLNAVPRPPAELVERIKADIPKYLEPESTPARFTRSIRLNFGIAASLLVALTSAIVAVMMLGPGAQEKMASSAAAPRPVIFPPSSRAIAETDTTSTMTVARTEEVNLDVVQEAPVIPTIAMTPVAPPPSAVAPPRQEFEDDAPTAGRVAGMVGGSAAAAAPAEPQVAEFAAPVPPPSVDFQATPEASAPEPALAPAAPPLPVPPPPVAMTAEAPPVEPRERRAAAKFAQERADATAELKKSSVFGISVKPQVFYDIRTALEKGQRPAASMVDVEALVNYFAGAPSRRPRSGVSLDVEVSPAAVPVGGEHVLRFTIDTPEGSGVAVSDVRVKVATDPHAVTYARRIGDDDQLIPETMLPNGTSVTVLYELLIKPGVRDSRRLATVTMDYSVNGTPQSIKRPVYKYQVSKSWHRATRRHRLASLGAVWGESLKGAAAGAAVAQKAEELATQEPDDAKAQELARAASASAAGGG